MPDAGGAIHLTSDYRKTALARAVPYSYFAGDGWYLPPDPDPESARYALRLFPRLKVTEPELVARARLSSVDFTPLDYASARWTPRPTSEDPWRRIAGALAAERDAWHPPLRRPITEHEFQRIDADYAIERLNKGYGAYFGWEMGLGKTLGACMVIDGWPANFVFIACPNDAKQDPWAQELRRFCPWLEVVVVGNTAATRGAAVARAKALMDAGTPTAVICHYQAIALIEGPNKRGWKKLGQWDLVVCDEAHLLQNRTAKFTSAIRRLDTAGHLFLSGSVMSGDADRLFVPFQIFRPKRYRSQWRDWNDRFLDVIEGDHGRVIIGPSPSRLLAFREELGSSLVIRPARQYLKLPEPVVVEHKLELHPEQAKVYHALADELLADLPDGTVQITTDGAALLSALRRTTGGVPDGKGGFISTKLDTAMADIERAGDSQILMFVWHKWLGRALVARCHAAGVSCGVIDGDETRAKRDGTLDLFKRGGYRVLVATIATLSQSVNLQNARVVGMLEESYDPIHNEQAPGRTIRQGQEHTVTKIVYRVDNSVDDLDVLPKYTTKSELRRMVLGAHDVVGS